MKDVQHLNPGTMTGTPTLTTGALTDSTQGLTFNGTTNLLTIPDSASDSLTVADGASGGMALELFIKFAAIPGSTKDIAVKTGSYSLQINSSGKLLWTLTNGGNTVTVTSATTIATNTWYHIVGVYNGDYTGTTIFGNQSSGSALLSLPADYHMGSGTPSNLNLQVGKFTALEKGSITSILVDMKRVKDATLPQNLRAVVFGPSGASTPGEFLGASDSARYTSPDPSRAFISFPTDGIAFYAGAVWLGVFSGGSDGNSSQLELGHETTGGTRAWKSDSYPDPATPFGTPTGTDAKNFAMYANYTATGRTGDEGFALLYINGVLDASTAYAHGIADTANNLVFASNAAVSIDEASIWNKKLTPVQVATHYAAR